MDELEVVEVVEVVEVKLGIFGSAYERDTTAEHCFAVTEKYPSILDNGLMYRLFPLCGN